MIEVWLKYIYLKNFRVNATFMTITKLTNLLLLGSEKRDKKSKLCECKLNRYQGCKTFPMLNSPEQECLLQINIKMATIVGIFIFYSRIYFMHFHLHFQRNDTLQSADYLGRLAFFVWADLLTFGNISNKQTML